MDSDIHAVTLERFRIAPSIVEGCVVLRLTGMGDVVAVSPLRDCLSAIDRGVVLGEITRVEFDIRELELLNSSCLKIFATFLVKLAASKAAFPVQFIVNAKLAWQERSLCALERLASPLVSIVRR